MQLKFWCRHSGGGSKLKNIRDLAAEVFELDIQKGIPNSINGIDDIINNPRYATTIGLVKYINENKDKDLRMIKNDEDLDLIEILKKYYKNIIKKLKLK